MKSNYTMEDIGNFLVDYRNAQGLEPNDLMLNIPLVGKKFYERAFLEDQKRVFFEKKYQEALQGSIEEQQEFIEKISPLLDYFYGVKKENPKKR